MIKIVSETEVDVSRALDLDPLDLFVCENCGYEIPIPPEANNKVICPRCEKIMDKSFFSPLTRTQRLWVSEKGLKLRLERQAKPFDCNCVKHYRSVIRFRRAIFEMYEEQGEIRLVQAVGMLVAFWAGLDEGVLKLLGTRGSVVKQALWGHNSFGSEKMNDGFLWDWLATMQIKAGVGRPSRADKLVLFLDAVVLRFCLNHYVHFLHDALRLRSHEFMMVANHASARREAWIKFWKAKRAVEVSCKRMWRAWFGENPEPSPQDWWRKVAREQGLIG